MTGRNTPFEKANSQTDETSSDLAAIDETPLRLAPKRERSKDGRRQRIIAAARELMTEEGLSMRPLAKRARVASTTPYNLFGSKNAIVAAVMMEDLRWFRERVDTRNEWDELDRIFGGIDEAALVYEAEPVFYRSLFRVAYGSHSDSATELFEQPRIAGWVSLLRRAVENGFLQPSFLPEVLAKTLTHIIVGAALEWVRREIDTERMRLEVGYSTALLLLPLADIRSRERIEKKIRDYATALDQIAVRSEALSESDIIRGIGSPSTT